MFSMEINIIYYAEKREWKCVCCKSNVYSFQKARKINRFIDDEN